MISMAYFLFISPPIIPLFITLAYFGLIFGLEMMENMGGIANRDPYPTGMLRNPPIGRQDDHDRKVW